MSETTLQVLLGTAAVTGMLHTLIPDHWLPFVLIGRARGWSVGRTVLLSGVSATVHVTLSFLLGLGGLWLGSATAAGLGESLEAAAGPLLVVFGAVYAFWSWRKGGHFHPGGALLHRHVPAACSGAEGDANPDHLHYHADDGLIRERERFGGWTLVLLVGVNPCVLLVPLVLAGAGRGAGAVGLVVLAYGLPTALLMTVLSGLGVRWSRRIRLPVAARHMEPASGVLIALLGAALWILKP